MPTSNHSRYSRKWKYSQQGALVVLSLLVVFNLAYTPLPKTASARTRTVIALPELLRGQPAPLSAQEQQFFSRNAATAVKYLFEWEGQKASVIFVHSLYWKSQHDPRNCYRAQGMAIDYEETWMLSELTPVKHLQLNQGKHSAIYWFQSPSRHTADFSARVFSSLVGQQEPWVMISLLFENPATPAQVQAVVHAITTGVQTQLIR